ncbi:MAG: tRNA pseudouridine(55) synthase TruB [Desulfovibrionaceae bacterium]|jgi:tRNA pseudouridine55 synthase|nr:tRNA pseudouridine(55) synthase TruB [Desulfovibrionaceae bacterium]
MDQESEPLAGVLLIDKPVGPTSFRIVQQVRRALKIKKVGHAGTLDPFASGLLVVCVGRPATRLVSSLMEGEKEYEAILQLGVETDTQDLTGQVIAEKQVGEIDRDRVRDCLAQFTGEQLQTPPQYSALKHKGKPLYYYARKGIKVTKEPRKIQIREIELLSLDPDSMQIRVVCSKGTYIRTLAADIGRSLGCGAHLTGLRRLRSGRFTVEDGLNGSDLSGERQQVLKLLLNNLLPVDTVKTIL